MSRDRAQRPWRAIAYVPDPTGQVTGRSRAVAGRVSAKTASGLRRFIARQRAAGNAVDTFRVDTIEDHLEVRA